MAGRKGIGIFALAVVTAGGMLGGCRQTSSDDGAASASTTLLLPEVTTTAAASAPPTSVPEVVQVEDVLQEVTPVREVLYTAGVGDGVGDLGLDRPCCLGMATWAPVVLTDDRVVIADDINRRWVTVENGVPSVTPYVDGLVPVAQPQADGLGRIFVVWMVMPSSGSSTGVLQVFADGNLANPIATVAAESATVYSELRLAADGVHVNWPLVADAPMPVLTPGPAVEVDSEKGQVLTAWQGVSRVWQFPEGSPVYALGPSPSLSDGSVVVWMADDPTAANPHWLWLRADGSAVAIPTPVSAPTEGDAVYVTPDGLVQLEYNSGRFEVARYSLPK